MVDIMIMVILCDDGIYFIIGIKMWILGGEYEFMENIVYFVFVCIKGVLVGVKGILLFLVLCYCINFDGSVGESNYVVLVGLNYKFGYWGIINMLFNFGEGGEIIGEFVGELGWGLV